MIDTAQVTWVNTINGCTCLGVLCIVGALLLLRLLRSPTKEDIDEG